MLFSDREDFDFSNTVDMETDYATNVLHLVFHDYSIIEENSSVLGNGGHWHNGITKLCVRHTKFDLYIWCAHHNNICLRSIEFEFIYIHPSL